MVLQDRARVTRETIIVSAAEIFANHGYARTSLSQVSHLAQVTKGALYFHFQSKEDLAKSVIEEQHQLVIQDGEEIIAQKLPALECMILMCRAFGQRLIDDPVVRGGIRLTLESAEFEQDVKEPYLDWIATMQKLTVQGQKEGTIRESVSSEELARYIVASFTGVQMLSSILTGRLDVMQRIEGMWKILLPGIVNEAAHQDFLSLASLVTVNLPNGNV